MTCVHSEECLITLWWERRTFKSDSSPNQCNFGDSISFQGGRRGEISFYLKQTRLGNDKPHCGRTSDQLIICLFHVQNSTNLQVLPEKKKETDQVDIVSIPVLDTFSTVMQALIVSTECFVYIWTVHDLTSIFMCLICRHNCTITFIALPLYYILLLLKAQWPAAAKANGVCWFKIISPVTDAPNTPLSEVRLSDQAEKMG